MNDSQRPRWYSIDGQSLPDFLRAENYPDVARLIEAAGEDDAKTIAALNYGVATCSGDSKAIMQQMVDGYQVAFENPQPAEGQVLAASVSDGPLADQLQRIGDFIGHSTDSILRLAFGEINQSGDVDEQIEVGFTRLRAFIDVAEAAMPGGAAEQLEQRLRDAFKAGLDEQEIALATARMNQLDVARLIRRAT